MKSRFKVLNLFFSTDVIQNRKSHDFWIFKKREIQIHNMQFLLNTKNVFNFIHIELINIMLRWQFCNTFEPKIQKYKYII